MALAKDEALDGAGLRAEGHANADLAASSDSSSPQSASTAS